jgi:hypothetical protein
MRRCYKEMPVRCFVVQQPNSIGNVGQRRSSLE